ncbi:MAG TPA: hypothetical protein VFQ60_04045, partial [Patescibacteria group bacterium]|nr:hypothetical protein [Patescibacteria group bacterium]
MREERLTLWLVSAEILILILLAWFWPASSTSRVADLFILLFQSVLFGERLFFGVAKPARPFLGLFTIIAAQSIIQTIWYYAGGQLGSFSDLLTLAISLAAICLALFILPKPNTSPESASQISWRWIAASFIPAVIAFAFVLWSATRASTTESIRTPWPLLAHGTLAAIVIIFLASIVGAWKTNSKTASAALSSLAILSVSLLAPIIYKIGFGFDGFLHRAGESILLQTGTLLPKPAYYIGQYVFVTWMARLFSAPVQIIDIFLVPIGAAFIPWLIALFAKKRLYFISLGALLIPFSFLIATTPQSFAFLLGFAALCFAMTFRAGRISWLPSFLVSLWALATHPLAGLPFFGITLLILWVVKAEQKKQNILRAVLPWMLIVGSATVVPLAFVANSFLSKGTATWQWTALTDFRTYASWFVSLIPPQTHTALWADFAAFAQYLFPLIILTTGLIALKDKRQRAFYGLLIMSALSLALASLFLKTAGDFSFLIDYERGNYADRLLIVAGFILSLPAFMGASELIEQFTKKSALASLALILAAGSFYGAKTYLALPRNDATIVGHGWSVGAADLEAVQWIDGDAKGRPYTVLADQSVSAAAVATLGFKRYAGDIFFYPIPTGGALYQLYLAATGNHPSREIMTQAGSLGASNRVYLVLNNYWWNADHVAEALR